MRRMLVAGLLATAFSLPALTPALAAGPGTPGPGPAGCDQIKAAQVQSGHPVTSMALHFCNPINRPPYEIPGFE